MRKDTILICGNGFDLAHSLKTKYSDFKDYCRINRQNFYENLSSTLNLNSNTDSNDDLWASLEKSIGEISLDKLVEKSTEHERLDDYREFKLTGTGTKMIPHEKSELTQIQSSAYMRVLPELENELKDYLLNQISFDKVSCNALISKILLSTSKVITFNYTETLETVYNISKDDILHIHGNIHDRIIIGHGNKKYYSPNTKVVKTDPPLKSVENIHLVYLSKMFKNTQKIYLRHKAFFDCIPQIKHVVVFGHSLAEVDDYYFRKIKKQFPEADWKIYIHSNQDKKSAEVFKYRIGLKEELKLERL